MQKFQKKKNEFFFFSETQTKHSVDQVQLYRSLFLSLPFYSVAGVRFPRCEPPPFLRFFFLLKHSFIFWAFARRSDRDNDARTLKRREHTNKQNNQKQQQQQRTHTHTHTKNLFLKKKKEEVLNSNVKQPKLLYEKQYFSTGKFKSTPSALSPPHHGRQSLRLSTADAVSRGSPPSAPPQ